MSSMFTSLLPFLTALKRQDMPSPQDEDGSNPPADQFDNAGSPAPSKENGGAAAASQTNPVGNTVPGTAQRPARTPAPQQSQDTKGDLLMRLLRSGLQGSNPNPLRALAPLVQGNPAPPLGVMPDGSQVQDIGYLQNAPSRISGPDVSPDLSISDPNQARATLDQLVQGIGGQVPPLGVLPDGALVQDMGYLQNAPSRIPQPGPDVKPNLNVSDPNQTQATLRGLMQGIGGPQNAPFGVLPDGTLYRDMGYLQHAPSKIFPPAAPAATTGGATTGRARGQRISFAAEMQQPAQTQQRIRVALANHIDIIDAAAGKYNIPRDLFEALIYRESGGNPNARSRKGAMGLAQLMPDTAKGLKDPYDPQQNVERAAQFFGEQLRRNEGNAYLALQAYNAGPERFLQKNGVVNYPETQDYAQRILGYQAVLQQDPNSPQAVDPDQLVHDQAQAGIPIMKRRAPEVQRAQAQMAARQAKRKGAPQPSPTPTPHP